MRLTAWWRQKIINKLIDHAFGKRLKELGETENQLSDKIYYSVYPNELNDHFCKEQMKALPDGWLPKNKALYVNAAGYSVSLSMPLAKPFPYYEQHTRINLTNQTLIDGVRKLVTDKARFNEEIQNLKSIIKGFLTSVSTISRFYTLMPDAEAILGKDFFGDIQPGTAIVSTADGIICKIAQARQEDRPGCCDGKLIEA